MTRISVTTGLTTTTIFTRKRPPPESSIPEKLIILTVVLDSSDLQSPFMRDQKLYLKSFVHFLLLLLKNQCLFYYIKNDVHSFMSNAHGSFLTSCIANMTHTPDVLCIQETLLQPPYICQISGYNLVNCFHPRYIHRGGYI